MFAELGSNTKVTMRSVFPTVAEFEKVKGFGGVEGGLQTLERLAQWLAGVKEPGAEVEYLDHTH
jgi:uncharacterized protein YndB with AHSA1/START domain